MDKHITGERICKVEATDDTLTGRGGLAFFNRYLSEIGIYKIVEELFGKLRKSGKGFAVWRLFKQVLLFFFDGTSRHLTYFDKLKKDSGFFDKANFAAFDELGIEFIATGKMYEGVKGAVREAPDEDWGSYDNGHQAWSFFEFGYRPDSWDKFYRAIYTRPVYDDKRMLLDFTRPDNVIITNIGVNPKTLQHCSPKRTEHWQKTTTIIHGHHMRGADELPHRGLKDFGFEQLPFKRFAPNCAFFYCMIIAFFLFECFKRDVLRDVIPISSYANTVRRRFVDFAAKIVKTSKQIILKIPRAVMDSLKIESLWKLCQNPPPIPA